MLVAGTGVVRDALGDWEFVGYMSHSRFDVERTGAIFRLGGARYVVVGAVEALI